jgi:hypothetical protein
MGKVFDRKLDYASRQNARDKFVEKLRDDLTEAKKEVKRQEKILMDKWGKCDEWIYGMSDNDKHMYGIDREHLLRAKREVEELKIRIKDEDYDEKFVDMIAGCVVGEFEASSY